jgi:hypothetical protein
MDVHQNKSTYIFLIYYTKTTNFGTLNKQTMILLINYGSNKNITLIHKKNR